MARYKYIIWDWNGTLFDDAWLCVEILNGMLSRQGLDAVTSEEYERSFDFPVRDFYERLGFDFSATPYERIAGEFMAEYDRRRFECRLQSDAIAALRACADSGVRQCILSAYPQKSLEDVVGFFGIRSFFGTLAGLDDYLASGKIESGRRLMAALGTGKSGALLVGDTVHDFMVAAAMGADCVLLPRGHNSERKLRACGAPVLNRLADVSDMVNREATTVSP